MIEDARCELGFTCEPVNDDMQVNLKILRRIVSWCVVTRNDVANIVV